MSCSALENRRTLLSADGFEVRVPGVLNQEEVNESHPYFGLCRDCRSRYSNSRGIDTAGLRPGEARSCRSHRPTSLRIAFSLTPSRCATARLLIPWLFSSSMLPGCVCAETGSKENRPPAAAL
jgi:hypothetical protein